jgi:hypothetical protein
MSNEDREEALTVCVEYFLLAPRSDAQAFVEAMTEEKKDRIANAIKQALNTI